MALADVNGDGKPDLVVANGNCSTVSVLLGNGNGTFQAQQTFASGHDSIFGGGWRCERRRQTRPRRGQCQQRHSERVAELGNGNFTGQVFTHTTGATTNLAFSGLPATATAGSSLALHLDSFGLVQQCGCGLHRHGPLQHDRHRRRFARAGRLHIRAADGGVHVFTAGAILVSSGIQTITAFDTAINALSVSASVSVMPAAATHFAVIAPAVVLPNTAFNFTVTALDPFGNTATGYTGTVDFTSSDSQALLPVNATLTNGVGIFSATLKTGGKQTLTATDSSNAAITGSAVVNAVNSSGIAPFVESINRTSPAGPVTNASTVSFTVTFSETVDRRQSQRLPAGLDRHGHGHVDPGDAGQRRRLHGHRQRHHGHRHAGLEPGG